LLVIVDVKKLRRAWLVSHFKVWAETHNLEIVSLDPVQVLDEFCGNSNCRIVILSLGADSVADAETAKRIRALRARAPNAALVVMSDNEAPGEIVAAVEAGAVGFVSTNLDPDLAARAFSFILDGGSYFPLSAILPLHRSRTANYGSDSGNGSASGHRNGLAESDDDTPPGGGGSASAALTARQQEVLELLRLGKSNKHIARHLGMAEATVKVHVRHIMRKLGATNRIQAALSAVCPERAPRPAQPQGVLSNPVGKPDFTPESERLLPPN
jgi:DNA-binding NarL/FixJ family response regulator